VKDDFKGAAWRLTIFLTVCTFGTFALLTVFAELRFGDGKSYFAEFTNVSGLKDDDMVRIAGVEVGTIKSISFNRDSTVRVEFGIDDTVVLTEGTRAAVRYDNVIGGRYLAIEEGAGGLRTLQPGGTIPAARTQPALDLDSVIGGFRPLFRALDPGQVNTLSEQLISALQGQGATIGSFLQQAAVVTNTLADRDALIGQVIDNLNVVLGSLGSQTERLDTAVTSLSDLVTGLAERREDISTALAYTDAAAGSVADLLARSRQPFSKVVRETDRAAAIAAADHDYLDTLFDTLPERYRALGRQGISGDFFSFYLCEIVLKLNGKGGQPVYVKIADQVSGRCAPK
jgi:phospholipid/cholesterol/gamma-HCH transport system substrate-binding protein